MLQPQLDDLAPSDAAEAVPGFALKSVLVFGLAGASWHHPFPPAPGLVGLSSGRD